MKLSYSGTVAGYRQYARKELLKAAFMGQTIAQDAGRIQRALDRAAGQDRVRKVLGYTKGGIA